MRLFFQGGGAVFGQPLILRDKELRKLRREAGQENVVGEPVLDQKRLREYRVVFTNYETVVNYQHSFARVHWSVVVTDEAQEYKTPSTKISHALKALAPRFRVACTGTPVETRLLDVWNLFDFLQPGQLGSAADFTKRYERPIAEPADENRAEILGELKARLLINRPHAFVKRREKTNLSGLPVKHEVPLLCDLSAEQREWHLDLVSRARAGGNGNHPLGLIHHLLRLYQHPALVPRYTPLEAREAVERCPKLEAVLQCLHHIKSKKEKVLIFTRSLDMQQLLALALRAEFGLEVDIVNGATNRRGDTQSAHRTRSAIIKRFRESEGFNVLILSPDVAGIGLTLVEANHVIHYGRWWNPAKESQATDRVYRIGQTREVYVYYPIARDPQQEFETFDEKLDALIRRRKELAADFLTPMPGEDELERELFSDMCGAAERPGVSATVRALSKEDVRGLTWDRFEALAAVLERRQGGRVILTPRSGDGGIDVLAVKPREVRLIQCKHTSSGAQVDRDVVAEVINAYEGYRARYLRGLTPAFAFRPVLLTNGSFTRQARREAGARDVQLVADTELGRMLEATPCTRGEIEEMETRRLASARNLRAAIERLIHADA
jgi:superfamily II DNA or RNA helicase